MKYYLAPMEGLTGYIYRNAYHKYFHHMDKYMTPFLAPNQNRSFNQKEYNDFCPEHNKGLTVVPQILTNNASYFIRTCKEVGAYGYDEFNLNLGCPSATVVTKGKGSGFLAYPDKLDAFLDEVFSQIEAKISIKTRLAIDDPQDFYEILEIYQKYPISELIIHPRVQKDFYRNTPNQAMFFEALQIYSSTGKCMSQIDCQPGETQRFLQERCCPVCYNGDIFSVSSYQALIEKQPQPDAVMFGRGVIANPGLINEICGEEALTKGTLRAFHDEIYEGYKQIMSGDKNVLFRMKELWFYLISQFTDHERYAKKIKKAERCYQYEEAVRSLFAEQELVPRNSGI